MSPLDINERRWEFLENEIRVALVEATSGSSRELDGKNAVALILNAIERVRMEIESADAHGGIEQKFCMECVNYDRGLWRFGIGPTCRHRKMRDMEGRFFSVDVARSVGRGKCGPEAIFFEQKS